ncbi:MAG: presenilin family intramembrane aspartyl protease [Candidatus Woesearchaeota archaeon]
MKHSTQVLILFIALFITTQVIGLGVLTKTAEIITTTTNETQQITVNFNDTAVGERPEIEGMQTIIAIGIGVIIGTIILLLLSKFNKKNIWKHWFFLASTITMSVTFGAITNNFLFAWILAATLGAWKIYKPNFLVHNITELFIYPGIALLLVPLINVFYAFILLVLISIYDAYAVWRSKHMITMAKFAKDANLFPGLAINYNKTTGNIKSLINDNTKDTNLKKTKIYNKTKANKQTKKEEIKTGILGGGDIAFPLIFAGTHLIALLEIGFTRIQAISHALIISIFAGFALLLLFVYGKKDAYYPAMPFISAGSFIGYAISILIILLF